MPQQRRDAQDQGAASGAGAEGAPAGKQTSTDPGQTSPNTGGQQGPIVLDPGKSYVLNPNRPDITFSGTEIVSMANRGNLLDQTQSELHKTQDLIQRRDARIAELEKEAAQSRDRLGELDLTERIKSHLKQMGIDPTKMQQTSQGDDLGWPGSLDETPPANSISPDKILQAMTSMTKQAVEEAKQAGREAGKQEALSALDQRTADQEKQRRIDEFVGREFRTTIANLTSDMPDIPEGKLQDVAKLTTTASALEREAGDLIMQGKVEEGDALWAKAQENRRLAVKQQIALHTEQQQVGAERERKQQIELISAGGPPESRPKYDDGPTMIKREARKRAQERLAAAKEMERELKKYQAP